MSISSENARTRLESAAFVATYRHTNQVYFQAKKRIPNPYAENLVESIKRRNNNALQLKNSLLQPQQLQQNSATHQSFMRKDPGQKSARMLSANNCQSPTDSVRGFQGTQVYKKLARQDAPFVAYQFQLQDSQSQSRPLSMYTRTNQRSP